MNAMNVAVYKNPFNDFHHYRDRVLTKAEPACVSTFRLPKVFNANELAAGDHPQVLPFTS